MVKLLVASIAMFSMILIDQVLHKAEGQTGPIIRQSNCEAVWTAPQTNTDGTQLVDLKEYRLWVADTLVALAALTVPTKVISAAELDPPTGKGQNWLCRGADKISVGQKYAQISAVDTAGNESVRSTPFPFVSADDVSPLAPTGLAVQAGP